MKIGIVAPSASPANGIGIYASSMADAFNSYATVESFWVVNDDTGCNGNFIRKNHLADYEKAAAAINFSCDVCVLHHGFSAYGWRDGGLVSVLAQCVSIPLVVVFHEVEPNANENRRAIGQALAARADWVVVMSQQAANVAEHLFKIGAGKIKIFHYGTPAFMPIGRDEAKKTLGFGNRPVVLSFGLMEPSDNLSKVIDAISSLTNKFPNLLFVHVGQSVGQGVAGDGYRKSLLVLTRQYGLAANVCFVDRYLSNDEWFTYLQSADLCIVGQTDASKTQCAVLPMAMSAGLAILSSPFLYANEILGDKMGEIVSFDDPRILATKIQNLLDSPKQLQLYRQAAGDFGAQFTWDKMAPKYMSIMAGLHPSHRQGGLLPLMNDAQLLMPLHAIDRKPVHSGSDLETLTWRVMANLSLAHVDGDGFAKNSTADIAVFLDHMGQLNEPSPLAYWAMGSWLKQNAQHDWFGAVQAQFKLWSKALSSDNSLSIQQISFLTLGLCEYLELAPSETHYLPQLRKWQKNICQWLTSDGATLSNWPEETFSCYPELIVLALYESSSLLLLENDKAVAMAKAYFIIEKLFGERIFMPLAGRSYPLAKVKRNEYVQWAEEAYWAMRLCQTMANDSNEPLMVEKIWQAYLWFLGDNNVRKSLVGFQTGSCACQLVGTEVLGIGKSVGAELFTVVLGLAGESFIRRINTLTYQASLLAAPKTIGLR